jgi:hypothetical protein
MNMEKAKALFIELVAQVPPDPWEARLADLASGCEELRRQGGRILAAHRDAGSFLESPAPHWTAPSTTYPAKPEGLSSAPTSSSSRSAKGAWGQGGWLSRPGRSSGWSHSERYLNDEAAQACPPSLWYRLRKLVRRHHITLAVALLILSFVVVLGGGIGGAVRDRAARQQQAESERFARQTKLSTDAQLDLDRAELLQEQGRSPEALAAWERAEVLAREAAFDANLHQRLAAVKQRLDADAQDQQFISQFEQVRLVHRTEVDVAKSVFNATAVFPEILKLFLGYAVELGVNPVAQAAARIRERPETMQGHLLAAIYECSLSLPKDNPALQQWLVAVLDAADKDPR